MKGLKKLIGAVTAAALALTSLPVNGIILTANAAPIWQNVEETVRLLPKKASKFHDTNGDGFGEFEGWGTSLCWWANRLGYSAKMTQDAANKFFGEDGLMMNIGRYNVGGGDEVDSTRDDGTFHQAHITRSDSAVPGYCVDVTKIETGKTAADYAGYDRVDMECGYAWNYDWNADKNQMNILKAAANASGEDFIPEAFSNSPPYFMTVSGCSSGALKTDNGNFVNNDGNNLRDDSYHAFATYMVDVIVHWAKEGVIDFQSVSPMNEPDSSTKYWGAYSNKQEGCHFDGGELQSKLLVALAEELEKQKEDATGDDAQNVKSVLENIIIAASDETSIDLAIDNYKKLSEAAKAVVKRIDTHTYGGSDRKGLCKTAEEAEMNLWMSEVDGAYTAGAKAGEMTAALGLAERIMLDLNELKSTAWILWNAIDSHVDSDDKVNWPNSNNDFASMEDLYEKVNLSQGYWGIAFGDHDNENVVLTKKYYGYGQFSRYIRPGDSIIGSTNSNTLVAYNPQEHRAVIVALNTSADDAVWQFDFSSFTGMGTTVQAIRSSGSMKDGENWADVTNKAKITVNAEEKNFIATLKANSITTFLINDVTYDRAQDDYEDTSVSLDDLEEISLNANMVTGSAPWNNGTKDVPANVVDGKFDTFFDGVENGWIQIDLGKIHRIDAVGYAPRNSYASRCKGASFYGSNDGTNWTVLYTIAETPSQGKITGNAVNEWATDSNYYRYIKYTVPDDGSSCCNIAEIKLYGVEANLADLITDYEAKAAAHQFVDDTAFKAAVTAAKEVSSDAGADVKTMAMASVVAAYDALEEVQEEPEKWNYEYNTITGVKGAPLYDTDGNRVQAHGGQIQKVRHDYDYNGNGTIDNDEHEFWYWIGEDKTNDYRPCPGVRSYISKDLYNWKDVGNVLKTVPNWETFTTDSYFTALYGDLSEEDQRRVYADLWTADGASNAGCVIERPKMLYNDTTKKYVIWFHADGQTPDSTGGNYAKAKAGVAISDSPFGPFKLLGSYMLNGDADANHGFDSETGHVRDMNLFKDDDGTAYVLYSSDGNRTMHIAKLNDEYTNVVQPDNEKAVEGVDYTRNFVDQSREAPAMFKYNSKYYIITSGCTGWGPNRASYAVADNPMGPWTTIGDPCTDADADTTYFTQSTCVIPVDAAEGKYIYMGDRWYNPEVTQGPGSGGALRDSRYVWVPVEFQPGSKIALKRYSNWTLEELEGKGSYNISTEGFPKVIKSVSELPTKITASYANGDTEELSVTWEVPASNTIGEVTFTGTVEDGSILTHTAYMYHEKMIYFFDCASTESDYVTAIKEKLGNKFRNEASDQEYLGNGAGYTGKAGVDFGTKNAGDDIWAHGYWAEKGKNIEYAFDLEPGEYTVSTGYQEWWNTARDTKITVTAGETELASKSFTLAKSDMSRQENLTFTIEEPVTVKVAISKTGSTDPVLSWISVIQDNKTGDYVLPDKSELKGVMTEINSLTSADFLPAEWKALQNEVYAKYAEIEAVLGKFPVEQSEINTALTTLNSVWNKYKDKKLDKSGLDSVIQRADMLQETDYTAASWEEFLPIYEEALDVLAGKNYTQDQINTAKSALEGAIENTLVLLDKTALTPLLKDAAALKEETYTAESWKAFKEAYKAAAEVMSGVGASQDAVTQAANTLDTVMKSMITIQKKLENGIAANQAEKAENAYTAVSWSVYIAALDAANTLLQSGNFSEEEANDAISTLADAKLVLEEPKAGSSSGAGSVSPAGKSDALIICDDIETVYKKNGTVNLGAEIAAGTGTLTYESSDPKVADVSQGKVTIKGTGICTITISLGESPEYKAASEKITLTVKPKKLSVSSAKAAKNKKLTVKWKKDATVTGYEVQGALTDDFETGLKKVNVKKAGTTKATLKGLKKGKKYYVRIRSYKEVKVNNKKQKIYSEWSKVKVSSKVK